MSKNSENEWIIDKDFDGHRIDYWLKKIKPNLSYPIICKIIRKGQIKVNKRKVKKILLLFILEIELIYSYLLIMKKKT